MTKRESTDELIEMIMERVDLEEIVGRILEKRKEAERATPFLAPYEKVKKILAKHYPPALQISQESKAKLDPIIAEAKAHPERFKEA